MKKRISNRPLEPIATVVRFLLMLYGVYLIVGVVLTITGHTNFAGWRLSPSCIGVVDPPVPISGSVLKPGVTGGVTAINVCTFRPSGGQQVLDALSTAPNYCFFLGVLILIWRLLREAEKHGLYSERMAGQLRGLGWFLLAGGLLVMVVQGEATSHLAATMVNSSTTGTLDYWQLPWATVLIALGVLSFARIMRIGSTMREDLDGTV